MTSVRTAPRAADAAGPTDVRPHTPVSARPGRVASDRSASLGRELADRLAPWVVGAVTLAARLATAAGGPTDWDSAQYAAAVSRFDVTHGRPQPPGYFLYVVAGRLVHALGPGTIGSLVLVSALASAVAAGLTVVAGRDLGGRWVGLAAGVLVAASPFAWFSGSIVSTYSFDLAAAPLLIILAWRARPHSWHGMAAVGALGLAAGFRQSAIQAFALLALVAVAGSVRRVRELLAVGGVAVASVAVWFVPMVLTQPGGYAAWARATRAETLGAVRATSVLDHAPGGATNLGTAAAYTTLALAPLVTLAMVSALLLGIRSLAARNGAATAGAAPPPDDVHAHSPGATRAGEPATTTTRSGPAVDTAADPAADPGAHPPGWRRPWYQSRAAVLAAAVVPPLAIVTLVEFAKGGYLLAFLPGAVIALLLAPAALLSDRTRTPTGTDTGSTAAGRRHRARTAWLVVASLVVLAIAALGAQRFLGGAGVLPASTSWAPHGLWLTQARYQAPYPDTRAAIRTADSLDRSIAALAPLVDARRDVVVFDTLDGGAALYRNAGWELPSDRVALVVPGTAIYNEQFGSLFYTASPTVPVAPAGWVYLVAPPGLPGLAQLAGAGQAAQAPGAPRVGDYLVWRISPGADVLGVRVVTRSGPRPPGSGIRS